VGDDVETEANNQSVLASNTVWRETDEGNLVPSKRQQ